MTLDEFVAKLDRPRAIKGGHEARCPAHDDHRASLSLAQGRKGVVLTCHAGCTPDAITAALGLTMRDLFDDTPSGSTANGMAPPIVNTYDYTDERGALLYQSVRYEPKDFRQRQPDGHGGWIWNMTGVDRVLYRLPEVVTAAKQGGTVFIVEGEKDADALGSLGLIATTNVGGAGKWKPGYGEALRGAHAIVLPDNDEPGRKHAQGVATSLQGIAASVKVVALPNLPPKGDVSDWLAAGGTSEGLEQLVAQVAEGTPSTAQPTGWARALSASAFLAQKDAEIPFLEPRFLMKGAITEWFSPRGLGKTNVAQEIAIRQAREGRRVLLLDRDNPQREIRRRLKAWGAEGVQHLKIMARDTVPPLTDTAAWAAFPIGEYDIVIVDSLDSTAEGVGEQDSSKPSKAIARLLDVARAIDGPAVLVLGNTIKSAEHSRGSGVVEDRADIVYEVRDATDLRPTGTKAWWEELPPAGAGAWAQRASRRKKRENYRLAFIPSKFRVGEEPDPFILEVDHAASPWTVRDATAEVVEAGETTRHAAIEKARAKERQAIAALKGLVETRTAENPVAVVEEAVPFLRKHGFSRDRAREMIAEQTGASWQECPSQGRGKPAVLVALLHGAGEKVDTAASNASNGSPQLTRAGASPILAGHASQGPQETLFTKPVPDAGNRDHQCLRTPSGFSPVEEEIDCAD